MKLLTEITEQSLGIATLSPLSKYQINKMILPIVVDEHGQFAVLSIDKSGVFQLPSGLIETDEEHTDTISRTCMQLLGCSVEIEQSLGVVIERQNYQSRMNMIYGYLCRVSGPMMVPLFSNDQLDAGYHVHRKLYDDVVAHIGGFETKLIDHKYKQQTDSRFLQEVTGDLQ